MVSLRRILALIDANFYVFQNILNHDINQVPSHRVINDYINKNEMDYRYEVRENPIEGLRNRKEDSTSVGR